MRTDYRIPTIKGGVSETLNGEIASVVNHTCGACFHRLQPQLRIIQVYADPLYHTELDERMQRLIDRLNTQLLVEFDIYRLTREVKSSRSLDLDLVAKGKDFGLSIASNLTGGVLTLSDAEGSGSGDNSAVWNLLASVSDEIQVTRLSGLMHPGLMYEFSDVTELTIRVAGKSEETTDANDETKTVSEDIIEKFEEGFAGTLKPEILEMGTVRLYYDITLDEVDGTETRSFNRRGTQRRERSDTSEDVEAEVQERGDRAARITLAAQCLFDRTKQHSGAGNGRDRRVAARRWGQEREPHRRRLLALDPGEPGRGRDHRVKQ